MLIEILQDTGTARLPRQQTINSNSTFAMYHRDESAASIHGVLRHEEGFKISQVTAEIQALRAVVLRLWLPQILTMTNEVADDIVKFNVAIDKAVAESVVTYRQFVTPTEMAGRSKDTPHARFSDSQSG